MPNLRMITASSSSQISQSPNPPFKNETCRKFMANTNSLINIFEKREHIAGTPPSYLDIRRMYLPKHVYILLITFFANFSIIFRFIPNSNWASEEQYPNPG